MLAVRRPGYGARSVERDDPAHANMREMWGCGGQWARPTDRDREATKAVGIIAHQANRREQVMDLTKLIVSDLVEGHHFSGGQRFRIDRDAAIAELTRRITEANARADRLAAEVRACRAWMGTAKARGLLVYPFPSANPDSEERLLLREMSRLELAVDGASTAVNAAGDLEVK